MTPEDLLDLVGQHLHVDSDGALVVDLRHLNGCGLGDVKVLRDGPHDSTDTFEYDHQSVSASWAYGDVSAKVDR